MGAAAQGGIFFTFIGAALFGMSAAECGSIAIIGGADGPTSIYVSSRLLTSNSNIGVGTIALLQPIHIWLLFLLSSRLS